ncbi:hypothetical protein ADK41_18780 [Streptomyces caelestis]|uniref:Uncharacterized protein n=1 Tax=Streptomyces caelestis TaxID=36816 RepID=A0A0M8QHV0_9ACTN|nr:hypothetical protein ADK41_18780 [Streptomyces caelestis]
MEVLGRFGSEGGGEGPPQVRPAGGGFEGIQHDRMRCGVEDRAVRLTGCRIGDEGRPLAVRGEPRVDPRLVAPRVLAVPGAVETDGDQAVHDAEVPVAEGGRDVPGPQQRGQRMGLGVADAGALLQDVGGAPGDPEITRVLGVRDGVAHELEGRPRIVVRVGRPGGEARRRLADQRMMRGDRLAGSETGGEARGFLDQLHAAGA